MKDGKIVTEIPKVSRRSKYQINWAHQAHIAYLTKQPVLVGHGISESQVKSIRQYDREPFVTSEGRILVKLRNSAINPEDGKRYGDVYFEWEPATPDTTTKEN